MASKRNSLHMKLWLTVIILMIAALACRISSDSELETIVEQELVPALPDPTEPAETPSDPIIVATDEPDDDVFPGQQGAGIAPEEIITISPGEEPGIYQPGDVIAIKDQIVMVLGWEILPEDEYFKPDPDQMYIAVDLIIVNTGPSPILVSSLLQTSLTAVADGVRENYSFDIMASAIAKGGIIDGELLPGERIRGKAGYHLPQTVSDLQFTYALKFLQPEQVTFDLGSEPALIPPPILIPGETPLAAYSLGEVIEINDLILQVNEIYSQPGQQMLMPSEGYKYVIVDLTLTTNSPSPVSIPWNQFNLRDITGLAYLTDTSAMALAGFIPPVGEYNQGETITLLLGYEVPESETEFVLLVDGDQWDAGMIRIALSLQ